MDGKLTYTIAAALPGLSFKLDGRRHSCLAKRFTQFFALDSQYGLMRDIYEDDEGSSGGESLTGDGDQAAAHIPTNPSADIRV